MYGSLTAYDRERYARQMALPGWGEEGQLRLKQSTIFVAGAGGLGSPVCFYLAVAGVGRLRVCDPDTVSLSNLNRQILHDDGKIGQGKATSAGETLRRLGPQVVVEELPVHLDERNVAELVADSQIIVDCLDNFPTRYVLNEYAAGRGIPLVYGGVWGLDGSLSFFHVPETPCLRCVFPQEPPREKVFPVVGVTPGVIGCLQAAEALKYLVGVGQNLKGRLLFFSGEEMAFYSFEQARNPECPVCSRFH